MWPAVIIWHQLFHKSNKSCDKTWSKIHKICTASSLSLSCFSTLYLLRLHRCTAACHAVTEISCCHCQWFPTIIFNKCALSSTTANYTDNCNYSITILYTLIDPLQNVQKEAVESAILKNWLCPLCLLVKVINPPLWNFMYSENLLLISFNRGAAFFPPRSLDQDL